MADATVWRPVKPEGLAATILGVTILFTIICLVVVALRFLNMIHNEFVMYGTTTGIGTYDTKLSLPVQVEGAKVIVFWQLFYVSGSVLIEASIVATLLRITTGAQRKYKIALYSLLGLSVIATLTAMIAVLVRCKPISASWTGQGTCLDQSIIVTLTYVVSGVNILTDWSVAIMPAFILWNVQMKKNLKLMTGLILGLGFLASTATIIRMPYSSAYIEKSNVLHDIGNIVLWTVVEWDIGIIAGSLLMLRTLFRSLRKDGSSSGGYRTSNNVDLVTIRQQNQGRKTKYDAELNITV